MNRGQHAGNADAVGDEVGRVVGADHAFAQYADGKSLQIVEHLRLRGGGVDQLNQRHVARGVEEVNAAKTRLDGLGQRLAQRRDRQARRVAGHDGVRADERRDLVVQVGLPVHALGNRFDDQVATAQHVHVLFVVGRLNQRGVVGHAQRRGLELFQAFDGFGDDAVLRKPGRRRGPAPIVVFGRQVKQHHRHADVDEVGGNLRAHHACAKHGDFFHLKSGHCLFLVDTDFVTLQTNYFSCQPLRGTPWNWLCQATSVAP